MKLYDELTTVLPFYTNKRNQERFKENVAKNCALKLLSPSNALLPFLLKLPKSSPKPTAFNLVDLNGTKTNLMNNISKLKAFDFDDLAYCYYNGEELIFKFDSFEQPLDLQGFFFIELMIGGVEYFSEMFFMSKEIKTSGFSDRMVKVEFYDEKDIEPIRYRNGFKQVFYLDTFIHTSEPEIEEENEVDGLGGQIPTFTKFTIKQKMEVVIPDFFKNAIMTMQMHDEIFVYEQNKREGKIDRIKVTPNVDETGASFTVEIVLETDILIKTQCEDNKVAINEDLWV